jgi:hypothetical protein
MATAAKLVQDDLVIMVEEDGKFHNYSVTWLTFQTVNIILTPELYVSLVSGD